jgi:septal ring factor EnvC (AmiA/AmiB activator)
MEEKLQIIATLTTLAAVLVTVVLSIFKPNAKQDTEISTMKGQCNERHKRIDEAIERTDKTLLLLKENDIKHIESGMNELGKQYVEIKTMIDERLPRKGA